MHAEVVPQTTRLPSLVLIAQAKRKQTDRQTRLNTLPHPTPAAIQPAWVNISTTTLPEGISDLCWLVVAELELKSASKFGAAGLVVIGGDRGEGNVIGWTVDVVGQPEEEMLECAVVGRCTGCVWFAVGRDAAG